MSEIPPPSSTGPGLGNFAATPREPKEQVSLPATFLMVVAGIGAAFQLLSLALNVLGVGLNAAAGGRNALAGMMQGGAGIAFSVVGLVVAGLIIFGALKMKKLQSYGLAMTAAVIAMIPCISPCCIFGLPIGIWALVILMKPEVKAAFQSNARGGFPI